MAAGAGVAHRGHGHPGLRRRPACRRARALRARGAGGTLRETGRAQEEILVPLAHTEGGLSASMSRGMKAAALSGGFRTYVLHDRMTRASCFICKNTADAVQLARWLEDSLDDLRAFLVRARRPLAVEAGEAARGEDARRRPDVPRPLGVDDRRRVRAEHDDPEQLRPEHGLRDAAGAAEARARDPRGEHGRRQEAIVRVLPVRSRQDGARGGDPRRRDASGACCGRRVDDLLELSWAGTHGAVASGMQSVAFTPASAIAAIFACTGQDLGHGRDELDGARQRPPDRGRRSARCDPLPGARGRHCRRRHHASRTPAPGSR